MAEASFGDYRDLVRIAVGGSAEVFAARESRSGARVALKVVLPGARHALEEGFAEEARVQERLRHPNLVRVLGHGVAQGRPYLSLELIEGPSLATLLARGRLTAGTALHIALGVLEALKVVHEARDADGTPLEIVHRDVTPQNIMFQRDGTVKLGDFGIARSRIAARTRTGMIKGKLGYLAPEQVTQSTIDARTDLYQVGLVLFEMLCGVPYFDGMSELDLLRAAEAPVSKRPSDFGAPDVTDALVQRALMRFPEERYASAAAFADAIRRVAATIEPPNLDALRVPGETLLSAPTPRRARVGLAFGLVGGLVLTALAIATVIERGEPTPARTEAAADNAPAPGPAAIAPETPAPLETTAAPTTVITPPPVPSRKSRGPKRETPPAVAPPSPEPAPAPVPAPVNQPPTDSLAPCLTRLEARDIAVADLPETLKRELKNPASDKQLLCAKLDAVTIDRPLVERRLARIQAAIDRLDANDERRPGLKGIARDTLQTLLDGNVARTNDKLRELEQMLGR